MQTCSVIEGLVLWRDLAILFIRSLFATKKKGEIIFAMRYLVQYAMLLKSVLRGAVCVTLVDGPLYYSNIKETQPKITEYFDCVPRPVLRRGNDPRSFATVLAPPAYLGGTVLFFRY